MRNLRIGEAILLVNLSWYCYPLRNRMSMGIHINRYMLNIWWGHVNLVIAIII